MGKKHPVFFRRWRVVTLQAAAIAYTQARTDRLKGLIDETQLASKYRDVLNAEKGDYWDKDKNCWTTTPPPPAPPPFDDHGLMGGSLWRLWE